MRVITNRRLAEFGSRHIDANEPLQVWRKLLESRSYFGFSDMKSTFGAVDVVGDKHVFNIRGNRYRIVCGISYSTQICFIKALLTHSEYDEGKWK
ncbi:type II toxin-antitoxin system HigB family toxin [Luteibacter sp. 22Crub2.1]|uniref:type II toxin-antitoxin system HigB family toxin n=1 Tax=Luteibacter sp. 22Crub2.1 TaxID=1283288 RepID=UPI0009A68F45|nr:type II toxin-antitoxin system HigB family toxin [Luteibacter sp. 22Crub2.1]SKB78293.1 mRNA interferase HigB [Luteibacter sp. 22Crub2.1]